MMKFSLFFINLSLTSVLARPSLETRSAPVQVAHLTFHAGPASYDLAVPADGTEVFTSMTALLQSSRCIFILRCVDIADSIHNRQ